MKKLIAITLGLLALTAFMWPVTTPVSGSTRIRLIGPGDSPMSGQPVRQSWGVYGYGGGSGVSRATTDATGTAVFPPRFSTGLSGMRAIRRARAFFTDHVGTLVFGSRGNMTQRWGPIVGFDIDLPPGRWMPAEPKNHIAIESPILGDGPHRYIYLRNEDPLHPNAYISGDAQGFTNDTEVVLKLRPVTADEDRLISEQVARNGPIKR